MPLTWISACLPSLLGATVTLMPLPALNTCGYLASSRALALRVNSEAASSSDSLVMVLSLVAEKNAQYSQAAGCDLCARSARDVGPEPRWRVAWHRGGRPATNGAPGCTPAQALRYTARPLAVRTAIIHSLTSHAWFPAWLVSFCSAYGHLMKKRHDDERTGWRDHGLQVRLVHP